MDASQEKRSDNILAYRRIIGIMLFFVGVFLFSSHASAATLRAQLVESSVTVTDTFHIQISVDAQGTAINAAESTITFPAALMDVTAISQVGIFDHWVEAPAYANASGTASFAGGLPDPGYAGSAGTILTIALTAEAQGSAQVCPTNTRILANDGSGTNVFSGNQCVTFTILPYPVPGAPTISSDTHPNQASWYKERMAHVTWDASGNIIGYSFLIDQLPTTTPDDTSEGTQEETTQLFTNDGVWYIHVKAQTGGGWGQAAHYRFQVDSLAPVVSAALVGDSPTTDTTSSISYSATDALSGVASIVGIIDGDATFQLDVSQNVFALPELTVGTHSIVVRATDLAGNVAETAFSFVIEAITEPPPVVPPEEKPTIIERIVDSISRVVPQQVKDVVNNATKPISDAIKDIRTNEAVVNRTKEIAEPIAQAAAAISVAAAAAALPATILNALLNFFRFFYLIFSPIFVRRKRKAWGTVVDSVTGKPIKGVVVRIFDIEFNKMKESQITDDYGRFGFLVEPGTYTVSAEKLQYKFPSSLYEHLVGLPNIYTGGKITVTDKIHHNINVTIPIDPDLSHVSAHAIRWKRFRDLVSLFLERINLPFLVVGTGVSVWSNIVVPSTLNHLLLFLYFLLIALKLVRDKTHFRSFGEVFDAETKQPLGLVVIRVFDAKRGAVVGTRISNQQGKFAILVKTGDYYVIATKPPYLPYRSQVQSISRSKAIVLDIYMQKPNPKPQIGGSPTVSVPPATTPPVVAPIASPPLQPDVSTPYTPTQKEAVGDEQELEKLVIQKQEEQTHNQTQER